MLETQTPQAEFETSDHLKYFCLYCCIAFRYSRGTEYAVPLYTHTCYCTAVMQKHVNINKQTRVSIYENISWQRATRDAALNCAILVM